MGILKLKPCCKDYIWGGRRLAEEYGIQSDKDILAEAWVLSCHPDGPSVVQNGPCAGQTLPEYLARTGRQAWGTNCEQFRDFPMLIKLIDARSDLSIQVHPSDEYALAHEGQYGKTEMWVALEATPGAYLYYGFRQAVTREEFAARIAAGTLTEVLRKVSVKAGDVFFIPSGTLHAIGPGLVIAEIQQNSNITYRVFDYNRVGADGKTRPLHVEKALEVTDLSPAEELDFGPHLGKSPYFTVDRHQGGFRGMCGGESFHALLVTAGTGALRCGGEEHPLAPGGCFFLPAGSGAYEVEGGCETLIAYV